MNDLPPLPDAICAIVCGSAGTGTVSPWTSIVPFEVPNAIESIGTPACFAAAVACSTVCGRRLAVRADRRRSVAHQHDGRARLLAVRAARDGGDRGRAPG